MNRVGRVGARQEVAGDQAGKGSRKTWARKDRLSPAELCRPELRVAEQLLKDLQGREGIQFKKLDRWWESKTVRAKVLARHKSTCPCKKEAESMVETHLGKKGRRAQETEGKA